MLIDVKFIIVHRKMEKFLHGFSFVNTRQKGDHIIYKTTITNQTTLVPKHASLREGPLTAF